jgi:TatD DNase family protein
MFPIADTHAHLDYEVYDADRDAVVERARAAGVTRILAIGIGEKSIAKTLGLAEKHEGVFAVVGVHPNDLAALPPERWEILERAVRHPRVVAIGETGLDYYRLKSADPVAEKRAQRESFLRQLDLARRTDKPVAIHCREALDDTLAVLREFGRFRAEPGVMHCFAGTLAQAEEVFALGYAISTGGILTFKNAPGLRDLVRAMPRDRLMLETDCPYLAPTPHRGQRNEPSYTRLVAEKLAEIWEESLEATVDRIAATVKRVFGVS